MTKPKSNVSCKSNLTSPDKRNLQFSNSYLKGFNRKLNFKKQPLIKLTTSKL